MDGKVIIGSALDSKQLDKDLKNERAKLKQFEKENQILIREKGKAESELKEYYQLRDAIKQATDSKMQMADEEELIAKYLAKEEEQINNLNDAYSTQLSHLDEINKKIQENELQQGLTKNNIDTINQKLENTKDFGSISESIKSIGSSTEGIVKKVAKWGLAVFGVRSAYMFIRQAMSTLSQYDDKLATDIQYIRYVLASTLKPIIETIINLVYKLLAYIGYIAKAWFGVNIFANASAKAFQKVNKGVKDTSKSAQKLQKTLAGFDEMNILQENGSVGTGGGGGGVGLPSQDLANLGDIEIPGWIKWIAENGELLKNIILGIGEAFITWKLLKWASELGAFASGIGELATVLQVAGIIAIVIGITNAIGDIINLIKDPSWDTFLQLIGDLSVALLGLSAMLIGMGTSWAWIPAVIGGIGFLVSALIDASDANEDLAKKTKSVAQAEEDLETAREARTNASKKYSQAIKDEEKTLKALEKAENKNKISGEKLHQEILIGTKNYKNLTQEEREVYDAYLDHLSASEKLTKATEKMTETTWDEKQAHHELTGAVYNEKQVYDDWFQTMIDGYRNNSIEAKDMADAMKTAMNEMSDTARKDFINNLPDNIRDAFNYAFDGVIDSATGTTVDLEKVYVTFKDGVKLSYKELGDTSRKFEKDTTADIANVAKKFGTELPNNIQKSIDKVNKLKDAIKNLGNAGISGANALILKVQGITGKGNAKGAIYYPPKLAVGGIINQPGRGVPLAMGGERGAEGVIPLTDSQAMSTLGQVIAKNISINLNNTVEMNGRVISRELKQIQNEEDFAFNGG